MFREGNENYKMKSHGRARKNEANSRENSRDREFSLVSGGGSFPIQKITLQIFLVSKRYILVVNFGKNVQKEGEGGGGHLQSKTIHCTFTQVSAYL